MLEAMNEQRPTNLPNTQAKEAEADTTSALRQGGNGNENLSPTQQRAERTEEIAEQRSHHAPAPDNEDAR